MAAAGKFEPFLEDGDGEDFESYIERFEHFLRATQAVMDDVPGGLDKVACYLDDVLIAGESFEECWKKVESVLIRFQKRGIKLRKEKCKLFETSVAYLGHVLDANGIRPSDDKHFGTFLSRNGIRHSKSPPYHPVSSGSAEVQTVKKDLFKEILDKERKGDKKSIQHRIDQFLFSYRNTPSSTTGETPAQIFLSWQPRTRLSLLHPEMEQRMREKGGAGEAPRRPETRAMERL
ncbi:hypothetical protein MTO96_026790 [Rhipicephalus appendiculatus]